MCCASRTRWKSGFRPDRRCGRAGPALAFRLNPAANGGVFVLECLLGRPGARSRVRLLGDGQAFSAGLPTYPVMQRIRARKQSRPADRIALRVADTDFSQRRKNALALDAFG